MQEMVLQGRPVSVADRAQVEQLLRNNPGWSRRRLSQELCRLWDWRNGTGQLKDMAARSFLLKLEKAGWIELPARRQAPSNRMRDRRLGAIEFDQTPLESNLRSLGDLDLDEISREAGGRQQCAAALAQFHYLGSSGTVGENLQYRVSSQDRPLAYVVFGSSAWKCKDRDAFIGWTEQQRQRNVNLTTNNTRFLILPWIRVRHLGSWILSQVSGRLCGDWQAKYGHRIYLVETFVERQRFYGTVYQASNWIKIGATAGRTRQDRYQRIQAPVKDIYVYPLRKHFRKFLHDGTA